MSALGQKQTCAVHPRMSAKWQQRTSRFLFDYLVRVFKHRSWHGDSDRPGGLQVDHEFECVRPLDREFGWSAPLSMRST